MFWPILFAVSMAQAAFLVSVIYARRRANPPASIFMTALVVFILLTNFGYFVIFTGLLHTAPFLFFLPFGMILLYGPLLYFYTRAVCEPDFKWRGQYIFHFVPYFVQLALNVPALLADRSILAEFISRFRAGQLEAGVFDKSVFIVQDIHLLVYLVAMARMIRKQYDWQSENRLVVEMKRRLRWLSAMLMCAGLFLVLVVVLLLLVFLHGHYIAPANYAYTLFFSAIVYFIAYRQVLSPETISPGFEQKYKSYMRFGEAEEQEYMEKLNRLMSESRLYLDPELKLAGLAAEIGLPSHQLSRLINDKLGKTFSDLVNEYRVEEFIRRMNQPEYDSYSILGIALEVGFNSKSSFNTAFKKVTGKTPTGFKQSRQERND